MDGALLFGVIIGILILLILVIFIVLIPVFSSIIYRKVSKQMGPTDKTVFGFVLIIINLFIFIGAYIFLFKDMLAS